MATTIDTSEEAPACVISLVGEQDSIEFVISGIDLKEYYLASQPSSTRYTPMGRFLEGPGVSWMDNLLDPSTPANDAGRKKKTIKNRTKGSMAAKAPKSERSI